MSDQLALYEELILQKMILEESASQAYVRYLLEFGEKKTKIYSLNFNIFTLRRKIAYCTKKAFEKQPIFEEELNQLRDEYAEQMNRKILELRLDLAQINSNNRTICFSERPKARKIYFDIAHLIHPDLHKEYENDEKIQKLWVKSTEAYREKNLRMLEECYEQVLFLTHSHLDYEEEELEEKIQTIQKSIISIKTSEPYTYLEILDDMDRRVRYHNELDTKIVELENYEQELQNSLESFHIIKKESA